MGQRRHHPTTKAHTLPSSPTHSFSSSASSDFEFTAALSPRKSSVAAADLCPADDLFYKGQLLPLHLSPRLSMVRTLLLSSASTSSSSDTTTTASRDSTASTDSSAADLLLHHDTDSFSARPSSAAAADALKRLTPSTAAAMQRKTPSKYFSLPRIFRKDHGGGGAVKRVGSGARDVIRKYLKKVKPLYEKLSQKPPPPPKTSISPKNSSSNFIKDFRIQESSYEITNSFSGNLKPYNRGKSCFSSCPSSMGSSPSHVRNGYGFGRTGRPGSGIYDSDSSSMEELQSAIQGAIAHCKNSMLQSKNMVGSNEI